MENEELIYSPEYPFYTIIGTSTGKTYMIHRKDNSVWYAEEDREPLTIALNFDIFLKKFLTKAEKFLNITKENQFVSYFKDEDLEGDRSNW